MDPDSNLEEQRSLAVEALAIQDNCSDDGKYTAHQEELLGGIATRLAELVQALDQWICNEGFPPKDWKEATIISKITHQAARDFVVLRRTVQTLTTALDASNLGVIEQTVNQLRKLTDPPAQD